MDGPLICLSRVKRSRAQRIIARPAVWVIPRDLISFLTLLNLLLLFYLVVSIHYLRDVYINVVLFVNACDFCLQQDAILLLSGPYPKISCWYWKHSTMVCENRYRQYA